MSTSLRGRDFLKEVDFDRDQLQSLIDLASTLKQARRNGQEQPALIGRNLVLIFEKSSTRTRCAFEVAIYEQGGNVTYLDADSSQMGHKESVADTAAVLSRMYSGISYRGEAQLTVEQLAQHSDVPVYNALTAAWHPTQMLADYLTIQEHSAKPIDEITFTYVGDARSNMGNSYLVMGAIMGVDVRICAPQELWPSAEVQGIARDRAAISGATITLTDDPQGAVRGADFIATDVWVSMGESPEIWDQRVALLRPYQVNRALLEASGNADVKFLHCLPSFHDTQTQVGRLLGERTGMVDGIEVTDEVFQSAASLVGDEAENRLHTIKAVLVATLAD